MQGLMPATRTFDREQVSAIILESIDLGLPLITTIMAVMNVTNNQARHMVRVVRQAGHLGTAPHVPARAMIHRGAGTERSWIVCEHCITPWPCPDAFPFRTKQRGPHTDDAQSAPTARD